MVKIGKIQNNLIICGNHSIIEYNLDSKESRILEIPLKKSEDPKNQPQPIETKSTTLNSLSISNDEKYLVISLENKNIIIYDSNLELVKHFVVKRCPSKVVFTKTNDVVVADKTGEVHLYKLNDPDNIPELLLGHNSILIDCILSDCGKYIITCDRDEKIRVSRFPNSYNIESYCLGHEEFVTVLKICDNILISGSGDGTVRFWDFVKGVEKGRINTNDYIKENTILQNFSEKMAKEKVDVGALPITDLQIKKVDSNVVITAVSIFQYNCIQFYETNLTTFESNLVKTINIPNDNFTFSLDNNLLFVLSDNSLTQYKIDNNYAEESFNDFYSKHKDYLKMESNDSIFVLYKRKFDNVQEYLERKKMRMEVTESK